MALFRASQHPGPSSEHWCAGRDIPSLTRRTLDIRRDTPGCGHRAFPSFQALSFAKCSWRRGFPHLRLMRDSDSALLRCGANPWWEFDDAMRNTKYSVNSETMAYRLCAKGQRYLRRRG